MQGLTVLCRRRLCGQSLIFPLQRMLWVQKHCLYIVENHCTTPQPVIPADNDSLKWEPEYVFAACCLPDNISLTLLIAMPQSTLILLVKETGLNPARCICCRPS